MRQISDLADLLLRNLPAEAGLSRDAIIDLIEKPKDSQHGDLAFPVFVLAKQLRKAPPCCDMSVLAGQKPGGGPFTR